jgi:hypothetical protein
MSHPVTPLSSLALTPYPSSPSRSALPSLSPTPQGKFVKVPAYDAALAKREAEAAAERERVERERVEKLKRSTQHPLANMIKKVPVEMAAPVLLHQHHAAAASATAAAAMAAAGEAATIKREPAPRPQARK